MTTTTIAAPTPWADTPLALIPTPNYKTKKHDMFTNGASHMCMVHNSIFRGYNSIYNQAPHISETDKPAFVQYALTWHKFLKSHAENEDSSLFVKTEELLDDKTIFEKSHEEHEAFYPGIAQYQDYLSSLKSPSEFSGTKLVEIMESFRVPLEHHMRSEIDTIAALAQHPNTPKEGSALEKSVEAEFDSREAKNLIAAGITDVLPFFLFNFDGDYEEGMWAQWPPIPMPVRFTLISVARVLHPSWWKFASCDASRKRKPLHAAVPM